MTTYNDLLKQAGDLEDQFGLDHPGSWLVPLDLDEYCAGAPVGTLRNDCNTGKSKVAFFVTPQTGNEYDTYGDLTAESGTNWSFDGIHLRFGTGKKLIVEGTLDLDDVTLTAPSGSDWGGLVYDSGSTDNNYLTDSVVEKVNADSGNVVTVLGGELLIHGSSIFHTTQSTSAYMETIQRAS